MTGYFESSRSVLIAGSVTAVLLTGIWWAWRRRNDRNRPNGVFENVGTVSKLIIYPVKSLPGVEVDSVEVTTLGFKVGPFHDRQWLIATKVGGFITQRIEPSLALLSLQLHGEELWINGPEMKTLKVKVTKKIGESDRSLRCRVWGDNINGLDCGEECALWFQKYLNREDVLLVQYVHDFKPRTIRRPLTYKFTNPGALMYHDDGCVHVLTEGSLEDLNSRLEEKVSYRNFRPCILVAGAGAFAEDTWKWIKVGTSILMFLNSCSRCVMTTVNPETGIKTEKEPLTTLKSYRQSSNPEDKKKFGESPLFGVYMGSYLSGFIKNGDAVSAIVSAKC